MSREQWGHGYWKGVEDAQTGKVRKQYTFKDEVKLWIAEMCRSNWHKTFDGTLFSVKEWVWYCDFIGLSIEYAKKVYDYILENNYYDFEPNSFSWCYVSGAKDSDWKEDYFVIPISHYTEDEWTIISDKLWEKIKGA